MRVFITFFLVAAIMESATVVYAQRAPNKFQSLNRYEGYESNERGLTLNFIVNERMWEWARAPSPQTLSRIDSQVHRAPQKGMQVEILTPGDFGLTLHYRW